MKNSILDGIYNYFTKTEKILWTISVVLIVTTFILFDRVNYGTLTASLIGVTALIFNAKGNPIGQIMMIVFSILYGIISFKVAYYGEMITYMGMSGPMSVIALISWISNPYKNNRAEVKVDHLKEKEYLWLPLMTAVVTVVFFFILAACNTASIVASTFSVTTSFVAVYLSYRRNVYYSLAYAANDVILIILWGIAALNDISCLSVLVCFVVFLANDLYVYICWVKMKKRQFNEQWAKYCATFDAHINDVHYFPDF